jgi:hypothetical protein
MRRFAVVIPTAGRRQPTGRRLVKAPKDSRARRRRAPIKLTPQELAWARQDAMRWRASLRAERNGAPAGVVAPRPVRTVDETEPPDQDAEQRARFAAAIARAELGRFYFKEHIGKPAKARKQGRRPGRKLARKPARNGKG